MDLRARFDDLRPATRRSFALGPTVRELTAHRLEEVVDVIASAESAVDAGHWVAGYVAYEAAPAFDPAFRVIEPSQSTVRDLPLAWFVVADGRQPVEPMTSGDYTIGAWTPSDDRDRYESSIAAIRDHIRAGDTYQVNHTFRLSAPFTGDPHSLYVDLSRAQSCGYGAFLDLGDFAVASASPELFFEWRHGRIMCKPMKGTTGRGAELVGDEVRRAALAASDKDRAENLMIVDMVRNDLGRIALTGTVRVPSLFATEKYDTVWQMTSTVVADAPTGTSLADVFGALFPSASITGAPKVATMQIITDLETTPRGIYCGAIGFGGPGPAGPQWAFNVAIRTVTVDRRHGLALYGTGGGITYDSTAGAEYDEAVLKAQVLDRRGTEFSLLETMRWEPGAGVVSLDRHLGRMMRAAAYFDVPVDPAEVRAAVTTGVRDLTAPTRVRVVVDRAGGTAVQTTPIVTSDEAVTAAVDTVPVDPSDPFVRHKTTNRTVYTEARARHPEADDVILINGDGFLTETTVANLAVEIDGIWVTPPTSDGCLDGVARAGLIEEGSLQVRSVSVADLAHATGLARINAVRGWQPLQLLDRRVVA